MAQHLISQSIFTKFQEKCSKQLGHSEFAIILGQNRSVFVKNVTLQDEDHTTNIARETTTRHVRVHPLGDNINDINEGSDVIGQYFQGDIALSLEQKRDIVEDFLEGSSERTKRQAFSPKLHTKLWKDGVVYYSFNKTISKELRNIFKKAAESWTKDSCVQFVRNPDVDPSEPRPTYRTVRPFSTTAATTTTIAPTTTTLYAAPKRRCEDHPKCPIYELSGICTREYFSVQFRKQMCPKMCNLCD
ncbi:unnamed protein product [Haemonchus placei]|uniref:Astacin domain-containing protein n=1 Tax=Haemonchus placei TaxID=6290 RepID=A0A0N4X3S3_HAEPC|nr:unnamed protein product [Haemonchus placei]